MKRDQQDELLKELLTGGEVSDFRQASLEGGLAAVRRQRRQRRIVQAGAVALVSLLMLSVAVLHLRDKPKSQQIASMKPTTTSSQLEEKLKIISDEELFALFPGRAMVLVGKPGQQQLVFLDGGNAQGRAQ